MEPPRSPFTGQPYTRAEAKHLAEQLEKRVEMLSPFSARVLRDRVRELRRYVELETN